MNVVNRTTRKDNKKHQTTNLIYDQKSMAIKNKIITNSNSHQIKPKQNNITYTSRKKYGTCPQCDWLIGRQKRAKRCEVQKCVSIFEKK